MKAYMSDIQRPDSQPDRETCGAPQAAIREARRILAETEPDEPQTFLVGIDRLSGRAKDPWTDALADALAAFVKE